MRALLTGATGNVGQGVLRKLVDHGHTVLAVGRNRDRLQAIEDTHGNRVDTYVCDLSTEPITLPNDYDAVVHAAAHATANESPDLHVLHNVVATRNLLRHAAHRPGRPFIFLSSLSVYGTIEESCVDETTTIRNPGSYGTSKLLGEMMLKEYGTTFSSVALRLPGVLGPGARDPWLARVLATACAGRPVSVYCPDTPFNNALHVDDLGAFVCRLIEHAQPGFDVLTVGAADARSVREVVMTMLETLPQPAVLREASAPRTPFVISIEKAVRRYRFAPSGVLDVVRRFSESVSQPSLQPHAIS